MKKTFVLKICSSTLATARRNVHAAWQRCMVYEARDVLRSFRAQLPREDAAASVAGEERQYTVQLALGERGARYLAGILRDVPEIARPLRASYSN